MKHGLVVSARFAYLPKVLRIDNMKRIRFHVKDSLLFEFFKNAYRTLLRHTRNISQVLAGDGHFKGVLAVDLFR
jgi:hypothetical protein